MTLADHVDENTAELSTRLLVALTSQVSQLWRHAIILEFGQVEAYVVERVFEGDDLPEDGAHLVGSNFDALRQGVERLVVLAEFGLWEAVLQMLQLFCVDLLISEAQERKKLRGNHLT